MQLPVGCRYQVLLDLAVNKVSTRLESVKDSVRPSVLRTDVAMNFV